MAITSGDVLIKFGSTDRSLNAVGVKTNDARIEDLMTRALNTHFFANEIAVAGVELPSRLFGQDASSFGSQSVGNAAAIANGASR